MVDDCPSALGQLTAHKIYQEKLVLNICNFFHCCLTYCVTQSSGSEGTRCLDNILFYEWTGELTDLGFFGGLET